MARKRFDALEIIESISGEAEDDIRRAAFAILSAVVVATPVGNPTLWQNPNPPDGYVGGHARRNWLVSLGNFTDNIEGEPGDGGSGGNPISEGRAEIDKYNVLVTRLIIQNNVPYMTRLNDGHSTQAPENFVQTAVQAGRTVGANDRRELP